MTTEQPSGGPSILVVEDIQNHAEELVGALREEEYEVDAVATAEDAIEAIRSKSYAAVLLDIELPLGEADSPIIPNGTPPERAGIEVLRYVRRELKLSLLPVIVVSGLDHKPFWPTMVDELWTTDLHVAAILTKPAAGPREVICELSRVTGWKGAMFEAFRADDPSYGED